MKSRALLPKLALWWFIAGCGTGGSGDAPDTSVSSSSGSSGSSVSSSSVGTTTTSGGSPGDGGSGGTSSASGDVTSGTAGGGGSGGSSGGVDPSEGCGNEPTLRDKSTVTIRSGGKDRKYILWLPAGYDKDHPYRLVIAYHWLSGSAQQVVDCTTEGIRCYTTQSPFYGLWDLAENSTIFIAPDGLNAGWGNANGEDITFTDDILKQVEADLCIDKSRIFANGFSFGGGMTKALGCARPDVLRAIAVYGGAEFLSGCDGGTMPLAFYGAHGVSDPTCAYNSGEAIRDRFVKNNGCTAQDPPEPARGSGMHTCVSYTGCSSGHPTRWCAFDGDHTPSPRDRGQDTTWNPREVWDFFTQF